MNDTMMIVNTSSIPILGSMILVLISVLIMISYYFYIERKAILLYFMGIEAMLFLYSLFFLLMINAQESGRLFLYARLLYTFLLGSVAAMAYTVEYITESKSARFARMTLLVAIILSIVIWIDRYWFIRDKVVYYFYYTPEKGPLHVLLLVYSLTTGILMIRRMLSYRKKASREAYRVIRPLLLAITFFVMHSSFVGLTSVLIPIFKPSNHLNIMFMTLMTGVYFYNDIRYHVAKKEELHLAYMKDELTGVYSRSHILNQLKAAIDLEGHRSHFIAFIDMDSFKSVNDRYGHIKGDETLRDFGQCLVALESKNVLAGRLGGDEFVLLFRDSSKKSVFNMLTDLTDQYLNVLSETGIDIGRDRSISIGVVRISEGQDLSGLMKLADQTMYEAKISGRNNVVFYR